MNITIHHRAGHRLDISIDLSEIQEAIYTEGAWQPAANATAWGVSDANEAITDRRVREGLDDLMARMGGYIVGSNVNFNIEHENIVLALCVGHEPRPTLPGDLKRAIIAALANYALMTFYGDEDSVYGTAWRLHRARCLILLAHPER